MRQETINGDFLTALNGNNFSGRTHYLKLLTNSQTPASANGIYIGEQPNNYISGILPTVQNEIDLHAVKADPDRLQSVNQLLNEFGFRDLLTQNPFNLSGGEQTVLVTLSNLLLQPEILAIDSTIEQLNRNWRDPLLRSIGHGEFQQTKVFLSDNRINEYNISGIKRIDVPADTEVYPDRFTSPQFTPSLKPEATAPGLWFKNISFSYDKGRRILDELDTQLDPGSIYHLNGENGAGKSTFAKIAAGILKCGNGEILRGNTTYDSYKYPGKLAGYSFQNPDEQLFSSSVERELSVSLLKQKHTTERAEAIINMFGLQGLRDRHPGDLPFVMRKRIALAATLAYDRPWYILDEPTLGQDESFVDFLVSLLNYLASVGYGIIIISHAEKFIQKIKCKKLNLVKGKLL